MTQEVSEEIKFYLDQYEIVLKEEILNSLAEILKNSESDAWVAENLRDYVGKLKAELMGYGIEDKDIPKIAPEVLRKLVSIRQYIKQYNRQGFHIERDYVVVYEYCAKDLQFFKDLNYKILRFETAPNGISGEMVPFVIFERQ